MDTTEVMELRLSEQRAVVGYHNREKLTHSYDEVPELRELFSDILTAYKPDDTTVAPPFDSNWQDRRWRGQLYHHIDGWSVVLRVMPTKLASLSDLDFDREQVMSLARDEGLTVFCGPTGAGKSTTMFSVMNELDQEGILGDTITIEHPVEYLHQQPHIEQRRVGFDTASFDVAIVEAMRLTPKTIVIGEIRDRATADAALTAGLTGHRVLATLHARNASEAIVRMINLLPEDRQPMLGIAVQGLMVQMLEAVPNSPVIPVYESLLIDDPVAAILSKGAGMLQQLNHEFRRQRRPRMTEMREELVRAGVISSHG